MLQWISENVGTILICMGLIVIVALIVRSLIRQKKQGKSSCGKTMEWGRRGPFPRERPSADSNKGGSQPASGASRPAGGR